MNKFENMTVEEMNELDGGVVTETAIIVACIAATGVGFSAGIAMGIAKWF